MVTSALAVDVARAQVKVLIAEARERARRRRRWTVAFVACLVVVGAVSVIAAIGWIGGGSTTGGGPSRHAAIALTRDARVTGAIGACHPQDMQFGAPEPPSQAGVVEVLPGQVRSGPVIAGAREFILPPGPAVAAERVGAGQRFSFLLRPGRYALLGRFATGGHLLMAHHQGGRVVVTPYRQTGPAVQFLNVSLRPGMNSGEDIPSGCL